MKRWPKWVGLLATLAAALTVLIIGINLRARQSVIAPTRQEVAVVATPIDSPLPTPTPRDQPLAPDCELKVSPVPAAAQDNQPANYTFEPPQVLIAGNDLYELAGWLPDNRRLLLTKEERDTLIQQIVTLDVETKEMKVYGERPQQSDAPMVFMSLGLVGHLIVNY